MTLRRERIEKHEEQNKSRPGKNGAAEGQELLLDHSNQSFLKD